MDDDDLEEEFDYDHNHNDWYYDPDAPNNVWLCLDCKENTFYIDEYYMLTLELWKQIHPADNGMLCIGCVEARLGRPLVPADFSGCPLNKETHNKSDRLLNRLGYIFVY